MIELLGVQKYSSSPSKVDESITDLDSVLLEIANPLVVLVIPYESHTRMVKSRLFLSFLLDQ